MRLPVFATAFAFAALLITHPLHATLPTGWTDQDIGAPTPAGSGNYVAGTDTWTIAGGGVTAVGTADKLNLASQSFNGNMVATAKVTAVQNTNAAATAGLMARLSNAAGSPFAAVLVTPGSGVLFKWRTSLNGATSSMTASGVTAPQWVKLTKMGSNFTAFYSSDGMNWLPVCGPQPIPAITGNILAGLTVSSGVSGTLNTSTFSNVSLASNTAPTVAAGATAFPSPAADTRTLLSVLGADDGVEANLTYTWATTGTPPAPVTFGANGTNASKNVTALFTASGNYSFQVTITDSGGLSTTSGVAVTVNLSTAPAVVQFHNDFSSDGVNPNETQLTVANVTPALFQKQFSTPVDGQVYAQPLYLPGVNITTGSQPGVHNVAYVATEHDSLYAIDSTGGNILWRTSFTNTSDPLVNLLGAAAMSSVPQGDVNTGDLVPEVGITSTPAIDRSAGLIYLVAKTKQTVTGAAGPHYVQTLYKVNAGSGAIVASTIIGDTIYAGGGYTYRTVNTGTGTDPFVAGTGSGAITVGTQSRVYFNALRQFNRSSLAFANGSLYVASASHGDNGPYHGWLLRYNAGSMGLTGALNTTPNGGLGGVWMGGGVPAIDQAGDLYVMTGNGTFDGNVSGSTVTGLNASGFPQSANYSDCFIRITDDPYSSAVCQNTNGWGLKIADYFSPYNNQDLNNRDADLGSGAVMLLPPSAGNATHRNLAVGAGKDGTIYLLDRANMGKLTATDSGSVQKSGNSSTTGINGSLNTPAFYNGHLYYFPGYGGSGRAYSVSNAAFSTGYTSITPDSIGQLDGTVSISANGGTNGIAWVLDRGSSELKAYSAANLATELWTSASAAGNRDQIPGTVTKFATPTVVAGQVLVGTTGAGAAGFLAVYGPPTAPTSGPAAPSTLTAVATAFNNVILKWNDNSNNEDEFELERSGDGGATWSQIATTSANATSYTDTTTLATTAYQYRVRAHNAFNGGTQSAYSNVATVTTPQAPPTGTGDGLAAAYYNDFGSGIHLVDPPSLTRVDSTVNFVYPNGDSPAPGIGGTNFSVQWLGKIQPEFTETYTFYTESDDGVRLWVNGQLLVDDWNDHPPTEDSGTITLSAGQEYTIEMDLYQNQGGSEAQLLWESPSTLKQIVPQAQLYSGVAPIAPANLTATVTSGTQINLAWSDNSNNETGFSIERKQGAGGTYAVAATVGPNITVYSDTGLVPNTNYFYRVQATNFAANSTYSNEASATTPVPPLKPTMAVASNITTTSIHLAWQDNATNEDGYRITRVQNGATQIVVAPNLPPNTQTFTNAGLTSGNEYDYHIIAYNLAGYSDFAGTLTATLTDPPTALAAVADQQSAALSWTPPYFGGLPAHLTYNVYRGMTSGGESAIPTATGVTVPSFTDTGLTNLQTYYYKVTAVDPGGESLASTEVAVVPHVTTFAGWQQQAFTAAQLQQGDPNVIGLTADPSHSGISNLLSYAFNLNPMDPNPAGLPAVQELNGYLTITYFHRIAPSDITYTVEVSPDLSTWNSGAGFTTTLAPSPIDLVTEYAHVRDDRPVADGMRFMRVKITH